MKFNTAIAALMTLINEIYDYGSLTVDELKIFIKLLCPFAPHLCEEIWSNLGETSLLSLSEWPAYDENKTIESTIEIAVQICGKLKGTMILSKDATKEEMLAAVKSNPKITAYLDGKTIVKEICIPGKLVNLVIK
jgi:leucyl-tRNA synthetase